MPSARVRITLAQTSMTVGLGLRKSGMRIPDRGKATKDITQGASQRRLVPLEIRPSIRRDALDRIDRPARAAPAPVPQMVAAGRSLDAESRRARGPHGRSGGTPAGRGIRHARGAPAGVRLVLRDGA